MAEDAAPGHFDPPASDDKRCGPKGWERAAVTSPVTHTTAISFRWAPGKLRPRLRLDRRAQTARSGGFAGRAVAFHRGPTHSLLALAALLLLGQWPGLPWAAGNFGWLLGWGFALHLAADALTKSGIPLFWPLRPRVGFPPVRQLRFTTGTWREGLIVGALTLACLANALGRLPR